MKLRRLTAMSSAINDYSALKWPLTIASVLITLLAFLILLSFISNAWFKFEITYVRNISTPSNTTTVYSHMISQGSFGLWEICRTDGSDPTVTCNKYTRLSRPRNFSVILILLSCALFLVNLTFFPSWASTILVLYNTNNRYIPYMIVFMWIMFILSLTSAALLICVMMFIGTSSFYAPGQFTGRFKKTSYHANSGLYLILSATIISIVCLLLVITTLIWKKFIEVKLQEAEKELYRQLADDNFQPGWHKIIKIPRTESRLDESFLSPPPYHYVNDGSST